MASPTVVLYLRLSPEVMQACKLASEQAGMSLNAWAVKQLRGEDQPVKIKKPVAKVKAYRPDPGMGEDEGD